jgi:hypothetical protein
VWVRRERSQNYVSGGFARVESIDAGPATWLLFLFFAGLPERRVLAGRLWETFGRWSCGVGRPAHSTIFFRSAQKIDVDTFLFDDPTRGDPADKKGRKRPLVQ